jgi:hypothetical protein
VSPLIDYSLEFVDWMLGQRMHLVAGAVDTATAARFWRGLAASNMYGYLAMMEQLEASQRAAALYRAMDRPKRLFRALRRTFVWAIELQNDGLAALAMEESEGLIQPEWGPEFTIEVLRSRSHLASRRGDFDAAIAMRKDAVRVARDIFGDWRLQIIEETCVAEFLWCAGRQAEAATLLTGLIEGMRLRPASDYELLDAIETQLWILSDLGDLPAATALARRALPVMRRMPRFSLSGCAHLLMRLDRFAEAARVLGIQIARTRAGLAPTLPPGLSALDRLQAEALAGVEAALAPHDLSRLLQDGEALGYGSVCDMLAEAVRAVDTAQH